MNSTLLYDSADTICAISTPAGSGGIAVIRISGKDAITITDKIWKGRRLSAAATHTAHLGEIVDPNTGLRNFLRRNHTEAAGCVVGDDL